MTVRVLRGDCRAVLATLPSASVHCCVTSPPYYGLRDYGTAQWEGGDAACDHLAPPPGGFANANLGDRAEVAADKVLRRQQQFRNVCGKCAATRVDQQIGAEQTPEAYVAALMAVFREVRRVLRDDGTLWLNLGDSYAGVGGYSPDRASNRNGGSLSSRQGGDLGAKPRGIRVPPDLKPKDLIGIPWRVAFALQADGWYLRQDLIWSKPNPMPESVRDRCTKSHEYVFLLTKSPRYFYDAEAISEPVAETSIARVSQNNGDPVWNGNRDKGSPRGRQTMNVAQFVRADGTRTRRSVWAIATEPSSLGHFALMPSALAELCIKAGTSQRGCCPTCGAPWVRKVEIMRSWRENAKPKEQAYGPGSGNMTARSHIGGMSRNEYAHRGCSPSCRCPAHTPQPCTVLDPFGGAGTTGLVADRLGRDAILVELSPIYAAMAGRRIEADAGMFASVVQAAQ